MKPISEYGWDNVFDVLSWITMVVCIAYVFVLFGERPIGSKSSIEAAIPASGTVRVIRKRSVDVIEQPIEVEKALKKADEISKVKDYANVISIMKAIIKKYPKQPYPYVYLARAQDTRKEIWDSIHNYVLGVKLNPNFVDKFSNQRIGPELKEIVRRALLIQRGGKMPQSKKKYIKSLYYLQRRLSGGCE